MKTISHILVISLLLSCSSWEKDNDAQEPSSPKLAELEKKFDLYMTLTQEMVDEFGFKMPEPHYREGVGHSSCDSLLITGLFCAVGGEVDIYTAEDNGRWYRTAHKQCFPNYSRSSISSDMHTGLFACLWKKQDLDAFERIADYGLDHRWRFGDYHEGDIDGLVRVLMSPSMIGVLYQAIEKLGGETSPRRLYPQVYANVDGFERHLQVISILTRGAIHGAVNDVELKFLRRNAEDQPNSALHQAALHRYTDGDQSRAIELLLDDKYFPNDRLPDGRNYRTEYLYMRDERTDRKYDADANGCISYPNLETAQMQEECDLEPGKTYKRWVYNRDWLPHPDGAARKHDGSDFIFAAGVALGKF